MDNVIIDGLLDDELWQDKSWYTQYEPTQRTKIMVTSAMSEKGFYIAANSNDQFIYWNGYNYFFKNTHFYFQFYSGNNAAIRVDAVSVQVNEKYINARSRVLGEYNAPGRGGGLNVEVFIPWHELGIDTTNGLPETVKMYPIYNFCLSQNAVTNALYPTFVKTMGDSGQVTLFGKDGYVNRRCGGSDCRQPSEWPGAHQRLDGGKSRPEHRNRHFRHERHLQFCPGNILPQSHVFDFPRIDKDENHCRGRRFESRYIAL